MQINSPWTNRIVQANKYYESWESRFRCKTLEDYYEGFQWQLANGSFPEGLGIRRPYTVNLVYATIRRKIANITYSYPEFLIDPQPGQMDWNQDFAVRSAQLKQAALNTVISNPKLEFTEDIKLSAIDSFFRFAVLEIGYASDYRNPNKPKMEMKSDSDGNIQPEQDKVVRNDPPAENQLLYTKWISAKRFRVSMSDDVKLRNCDWCGYYGFIPKEVLLNTKEYQVPKDLKDQYFSVDVADAKAYFADSTYSKEAAEELAKRGSLVKYWRIWDNKTQEEKLIIDGNYEEVFAKPFERIPLATHRFDLSLKGWYPIPPVWQWLSAQNEVNESREQMRRYRARSTRKFEVSKGDHDLDELEKLKTNEDGSVIVTKRKDGQPSVRPIQNPDINIAIAEGLTTAKDDFDIVAAIPVATGRASDRQTATATKKLSADQAIIESLEQIDFSKFVAAAGREILLQMSENMDQGMWVKLSSDPGEDIVGELEHYQDVYRWITTQDLADGYDFSIKINVKDSTPANMELEEVKFVKFLTLVKQFPEIALDPDLIRETAYRVGYKNEKIIARYQKMAQLFLMERANMAAQSVIAQAAPQIGGNGGNANNMKKGMIDQGQPNSVDEITNQLNMQVQ